MARCMLVVPALLAACAASPVTSDGSGGDNGKADGTGGSFEPAPHRAWPQVPQRDGIVLSAMKLVWITSPDDDAGRAYYGPLFDALAAQDNRWWTETTGEYFIDPPRQVISVRGPSVLDGTTPFRTSDLKEYVANAIAGDPTLAPDGTTLYMLLLPEHVGAGARCSAGGSHTAYGQLGDTWAHVTRCGATVGMRTATHEIVEAASDPTARGYRLAFDGTSAWTSSVFAATDGELGDLCSDMGSFVADGVKYQRSWSNAAAAEGGAPCVPAAKTPFFAVSVAHDWYPIAPGASIEIRLTGFSTAKTAPWAISAHVQPRSRPGTGAGYHVMTTTDTIGNGGKSSLVVQADATVAPGSWALIEVVSDGAPLGIAESYAVPVGVYVAGAP